jgi:hypothetical protein
LSTSIVQLGGFYSIENGISMNMDIIINWKDASIVIHAIDRLQIFKQAYDVIDNLSSKDPQKHETL